MYLNNTNTTHQILAHDVSQHVDAAAMSHADDDFLDTVGAGMQHGFVQQWDQAVATLQREPFLAYVACVQVFFQAFGGGQTLENMALDVGAVLRVAAHALQPLLKPALLGGVDDVHVLTAHRGAIGALQAVHDLAQGGFRLTDEQVAGHQVDRALDKDGGVERLLNVQPQRLDRAFAQFVHHRLDLGQGGQYVGAVLAVDAHAHGRVAVLGDMLELGDETVSAHEALAAPIDKAGVDRVYLVGAAVKSLAAKLGRERLALCVENTKELQSRLERDLRAGDVVMLKGSNGIGLSRIVDHFIDAYPAQTPSDELL